eukprot:PhF_6_TR7007/c0_g1_i2/m.10410/K01267/DNPEP; aspartyl aminopeptidase
MSTPLVTASSFVTKDLLAQSNVAAKEFIDFLTKAVTPFHAVQLLGDKLKAKGFTALDERAATWDLKHGQSYYVTRNASSLIAFTIGGKFKAENGAKIVGAHTDSPNLQVKPRSHFSRQGCVGVATQCYGGGLWHTWFDRDLTLGGKVIYRQKASTASPTALLTKIINVQRPILRIPNLAIHLCSEDERAKFAPNKESHIAPILSTTIASTLNGDNTPETSKHAGGLLRLLFEAIGETPESAEILDFDLSVFDAVPPALGGLYDELICSGRLDNLNSCWCAVEALLKGLGSVAEDPMVRMAVLFDHEEVGSQSPSGAEGSLVPDVVDRLLGVFGQSAASRPSFVANSFLISADCAHAVHPNYGEKHNSVHAPKLHEGPVVKMNCNMRYATNAETSAMLKVMASLAQCPIQEFTVRNDSPCGTTIGPILSALMG